MTKPASADGGSPLQVSLSEDHSRAAFRLFHPKGNIITAAMLGALSQALDRLRRVRT